jgi:hypothetical protein
MLMTGLATADAERAFVRASRARRWAALKRRLRRQVSGGALPVYDETMLARARALPRRGVQEIQLDSVAGTLEPGKARLFDACFMPRGGARTRWQRVWVAEQRGTVLPPIEVLQVPEGYIVRDGHHRLSVARARGGRTIDAIVGAA